MNAYQKNEFMMFLFIISLFCGNNAVESDNIQLVAVSPNTTVSIPGSQYIAKNIDRSSADYRLSEGHVFLGKVLVDGSEEHEQLHGLIHDNTGSYYSSRSVVAHTCSLQEKDKTSIFYETIPTVFKAGSAALIPCLVSGVPTPTKRIERCSSSTCEKLLEIDFPDSVYTADSHIIVRQPTVADSGWYRCVARNLCGTSISKPTFIEIRESGDQEDSTESPAASGYVISRKTDDFLLFEKEEKHLGLTKELKRNLTEYELWKLNTASPSYHDEVLYLSSGSIYLYYYPTFTSESRGLSFTEMSDTRVLHELNYGVATHNNSFVTHFSTLYPYLRLIFTTDVAVRPEIVPPNTHRVENAEDAVIDFTVYKMPDIVHRIPSSVQCYRDTLRLENNWKTRLEVSDRTVSIILRYPLKSDSGYYQCSISHGILYISRPVYVSIENPVTTYQTKSNTTSTSVRLSWELLPLPDFQYGGNFVVFLSDHHPVMTSDTSIEYKNLKPHTKYMWYVTSTNQTPITDTNVFRTDKTIPTSNVGNVSVIRREKELSLSWPTFPNSSWIDDSVYFEVNVTVNSSLPDGAGEVRTLKTYTEAVRIAELHEATVYNITISPCNSQGCSENLTRVTATTKHFQIRDKPTVSIVNIGLTHADIATGNITNTTNTETYIDVFSGDLCSTAPSLPSDNLMKIQTPIARLENLNTFATYSVRVQITNGYSTSPWSSCRSFKTRFNWLHVIIPATCFILVLALGAVLRAAVKNRCPDVVSKLKQALEPKYVNILPGEEWETSNEVAIIHTRTDNSSV